MTDDYRRTVESCARLMASEDLRRAQRALAVAQENRRSALQREAASQQKAVLKRARPKVTLEQRRRRVELESRGITRREFTPPKIEFRELVSGDGPTPVCELLASRFSNWYHVPGLDVEERIMPGAFRRSLGNNPLVSFVLSHGSAGSGIPLADTRGGLKLWESDEGLMARARLNPDDPDVQLLSAKVAAGTLNGASFAFRVPKGGDEWDDRGRRSIREVNLSYGDVTVCWVGTNPGAGLVSLSSRSAQPRAGSPPSRKELIRRTKGAQARQQAALQRLRKAGPGR